MSMQRSTCGFCDIVPKLEDCLGDNKGTLFLKTLGTYTAKSAKLMTALVVLWGRFWVTKTGGSICSI